MLISPDVFKLELALPPWDFRRKTDWWVVPVVLNGFVVVRYRPAADPDGTGETASSPKKTKSDKSRGRHTSKSNRGT